MENIVLAIKNIVTEVVVEITQESKSQVTKKLSKYDLDNKISSIIMDNIGKFATVKKLKDPDAPKRAMTSYIAFYKENASTIKSKYGVSSAPEVSKKAGELWTNLTPREKVKYEKIASKDKQRYEEEKNAYRTPSQEEIKQKIDTIKEEKKIKDPNAPKKWKTSYMFFGLKNRATIKEETGLTTLGDISKEISRRWKELDDEQKQEYVDLETEDKDRYKEEMESYVKPSIEELKEIADNKPKRKTSSKVSRKSSDGIKKPRSSYIFFCMERRPTMKEENPEYSSKDIMSNLGSEWKQMDSQDKKKYQEMASDDKERYNSEISKENSEEKTSKVPLRKKSDEVKEMKKTKSEEEEKKSEEEDEVVASFLKIPIKKSGEVQEKKKNDKHQKPTQKKKVNLIDNEDFGEYSD